MSPEQQAAPPRRHFGDPCIYCNAPHDEVQPGPCPGNPHPWGEPWALGRQHATCGMPRLNPDFFKRAPDQLAYIRGYDGLPRQDAATPPPAAPGEITQEQALLAAEQRGMDVGLQWAAYIASMACLVPPDGGSPSEEEAAICEEAERRILSLVGRKPSVVDLRHYERKAADIRAALAGVPRE